MQKLVVTIHCDAPVFDGQHTPLTTYALRQTAEILDQRGVQLQGYPFSIKQFGDEIATVDLVEGSMKVFRVRELQVGDWLVGVDAGIDEITGLGASYRLPSGRKKLITAADIDLAQGIWICREGFGEDAECDENGKRKVQVLVRKLEGFKEDDVIVANGEVIDKIDPRIPEVWTAEDWEVRQVDLDRAGGILVERLV